MTVHNALTQNTPLSRAVARAMGLDAGGLERVSETLTPTMPLYELPEWAYLRGEYLATQLYTVAAGGAATFAALGVAPDNGHICVVEAPTAGMELSGAAGEVNVYINTRDAMQTNLPNVQNPPIDVDVRLWTLVGGGFPARYAPVSMRSATPAAITGTLVQRMLCNQATPMREPMLVPIVLLPGFAAVFSAPTANTGISLQLYIRVRTLVPGEASA